MPDPRRQRRPRHRLSARRRSRTRRRPPGCDPHRVPGCGAHRPWRRLRTGRMRVPRREWVRRVTSPMDDPLGPDALDFWLGTWRLSWAGGGLGTNTIRRILDDRVIEETF